MQLHNRCNNCQNCEKVKRVQERVMKAVCPPFSHADDHIVMMRNDILKEFPCESKVSVEDEIRNILLDGSWEFPRLRLENKDWNWFNRNIWINNPVNPKLPMLMELLKIQIKES